MHLPNYLKAKLLMSVYRASCTLVGPPKLLRTYLALGAEICGQPTNYRAFKGHRLPDPNGFK